MSLIDYGALLRVNGEFVNKDQNLFMDFSDTGYVCKEALWKDGNKYDIDGNYFVYAGDEHFMICFYKGFFDIISDEVMIYSGWNDHFIKETLYFKDLPDITIEHLDKNIRTECLIDTPDEFDIKDLEWRYGKKKGKQKIRRIYKRISFAKRRQTDSINKYYSNRWLATWMYNGNKYEVIFGYGIDPNEKVWDSIKNNGYNFSDVERNIIDNWFKGE